MTPADIPREAASVFDDANANKLGKYTTDPPTQVDNPAPTTRRNAKASVEIDILRIRNKYRGE